MSSLIVKVTQNGSSREYLFNRPGPIIIGSDERSDLWLNDPKLEMRLLEVKLSGGQLFVKELGARSEIYLNAVILPYREETLYHEGDTISLKNLNYQIHIHRTAAVAEPPPFVESDLKGKLDKATQELKERQQGLKKLHHLEEKTQGRLQDLEGQCHRFLGEKKKLEIEVNSLKAMKESLASGIKQTEKGHEAQLEKDHLLKNHIEKLEQEERTLKETILATNQSLSRLKNEQERKNKDLDEQRFILSNLEREATQIKTKIAALNQEESESEREVMSHGKRLQKVLKDSEGAMRERERADKGLHKLMNEKALLEIEVKECQERLNGLNETQRLAEKKILGLKSQVLEEEARYASIQETIGRHQEQESALKSLNLDLRAELDKAEGKLKLKKDQLNQFDYQCQDTMRKLTTANFELERVGHHLKELTGEEEAQGVKIIALREEIQSLSKKSYQDKKELQKGFAEERHRLELGLKGIQHDVESARRELAQLEMDRNTLSDRQREVESKCHDLMVQKKELESQVEKQEGEKVLAQKEVGLLKAEALRLQQEKGRIEKELSLLQVRFLDAESKIKEREEEARVSLEDYKREERSKMLAEKEVLLSEVEVFKQKSLLEVDMSFRRQQDEISDLKLCAQREADDILKDARKVEEEVTSEARLRLKEATKEAHEREVQSHERVKEAQEYFKRKEAEADEIIQRSRLESRNMLQKTEHELMEDLARRKQKIKNFLSMKQEKGLTHMKLMEEQQLARMKKNEARGAGEIEQLKRRELKKIARLREEELSRQNEHKTHALKEVHAEKERMRKQFSAMRTQQETELAETKKAVLEHINQTKFRQQNAWEEELKSAKQQFELSKDARIKNATQAVMNVMVGELGCTIESPEEWKERIQSTLKMAIDGQNAEAMKQVGQVLDMNPLLRKRMLPVLKKYALKFGIPAAVVVIMLADVGSLRTALVDYSKEVMTQSNSASDIFVKQQKEAWKEKYTYNPPTTPGYKSNFTDNVLHTSDFEAVLDDERFQNDWILKVHDFMVKELELSEDVAINYISAEGTLVKELVALKKEITPQFKDQGIAKMTASEETHLGWLKEKLTDPAKAQKFSDFRKDFYDRFYSEKFQSARDVASEPKPN